MSDAQQTLAAFHRLKGQGVIDERQWRPQNGRVAAARRCQNCGGHVTGKFRRTFGDRDDRVYACPGCATMEQITDGAASAPDYDLDRPVSERRSIHAGNEFGYFGGP